MSTANTLAAPPFLVVAAETFTALDRFDGAHRFEGAQWFDGAHGFDGTDTRALSH